MVNGFAPFGHLAYGYCNSLREFQAPKCFASHEHSEVLTQRSETQKPLFRRDELIGQPHVQNIRRRKADNNAISNRTIEAHAVYVRVICKQAKVLRQMQHHMAQAMLNGQPRNFTMIHLIVLELLYLKL